MSEAFNHQPGFYPGIPAEVYHSFTAMPYASRSVIAQLAEGWSPAHVHYELTHPSEPTAALEFGRALHEAVLTEGALIQVGPTATRSSKAWKAAVEADPTGLFVTEDEQETIAGVLSSLAQHPQAAGILSKLREPTTIVEGTGLWRTRAVSDPEPELRVDLQQHPIALDENSVRLTWPVDTGLPCMVKFRPDIWLGEADDPKSGIIVDLKSTGDARVKEFTRSVFNYGYDMQGGFYFEGFKRLGYRPKAFVLLAVEKSPPYAVRVYRLMPEVLEFGWNRIKDELRTFAKCQHSGLWPAYESQVEQIGLPAWADKVLFD